MDDPQRWLRQFVAMTEIRSPLERAAAASAVIDTLEEQRDLCSAIRDLAILAALRDGGRPVDVVHATGMSPSRVSQVTNRATRTKIRSAHLIAAAKRQAVTKLAGHAVPR